MIAEPVRHRCATWVIRGAGRSSAPTLRRSRYAGITLREAEGLLLGPGQVREIYGPAPEAHSLAELEDCTGEWVGLLADATGGQWVALTDFHGFGHLFYHVHRSGDGADVYLGTTLDALVDRLRADGLTLSVDWAVAATTLASNHTLLRNHWAEETLVEGVRCLRPDEVLLIGESGVGTVPRPMTSDPQGRSYDDLLDAGIARSIGLLQQVADSFCDLRVFASGGRDSRVVLALLAEADIAERVRFVAADPLRWPDRSGRPGLWRDLVVADELRRDLGSGWYAETEHEDRMVSFEESIRHHQSFHAGRQWAFAAERQLRRPLTPYVAIRGGAGELMRTAYATLRGSAAWRPMGDTATTLGADTDLLHGLCVNPQVPLPDELVAAGREVFGRAFACVPDAGISEQVDGHYRLHRNRVHFGHILHSLHRSTPAHYPLAVPEFLRAAQLLPFEQRDTGLAAFDVIERLRPWLNRRRFEKGSWPDQVWQRRDPSFTDRPKPPEGPFTRDRVSGYFDVEDVNHGMRGSQSAPQRFEIRGATQTRAVEHLWRLHDLAPGEFSADLAAGLAEQVGLGTLNAASTVVRLQSLLHAIDTPDTDTPPADVEVRLRTAGRGGALHRLLRRPRRAPEPERHGATGSVRTLTDIAMNRPGAGLETFEVDPATPPALFCHAAWVDGELLARRVGAERAGWALRHTFTLLQGTTTIVEVDAGEQVHAVLARDPEPGSYRVRLTARLIDRPEVAFRALSLPVVVPAPD